MQDAITAVINSADVQGKYLDQASMDKLKAYFQTGELRVRAATDHQCQCGRNRSWCCC